MILDNCYQGAPTDMLTGGIRHDVMRSRNRSLVIGAVRRAGNPSRTQIAHLTGLSHSTISAIAADLIAEGIMRESVHERSVHARVKLAVGGVHDEPAFLEYLCKFCVSKRLATHLESLLGCVGN